MAKDNREILSGVRIGNDVYLPGQEDEVASRLSPKDGERLIEAGALAGDWDFGTSQDDDEPKLTAKVAERLAAANIETNDSLRNVDDEALKGAGLSAPQIKNVRSVYGEYEAPQG